MSPITLLRSVWTDLIGVNHTVIEIWMNTALIRRNLKERRNTKFNEFQCIKKVWIQNGTGYKGSIEQ